MAEKGTDELEALVAEWHAHGDSEKLFRELRGPMRRSARRGLRFILGETPDEHDVDEAVLKAFREVLRKENPRSLVGYACTVAKRRGMDIARSIYRKRNHLRENAWKINQLRWSLEDEEAAAQDELLYRQAEDCLAELTPEQREVIELTVRQQKSLSEWAMRRGVSYEAARRMRERGVNSLRRCVERKSADGDGEVL